MEPVTMMMAASTAMGAISSIQQGNAQSASFQSQANAAEYNAKVAEQNAAASREQANYREEQQRANARRFLGTQRAAVVQSGTEASSGSNAAVQGDSAVQAEMDALMIRYGGEMQARGYTSQADMERYQAQNAMRNASTARTSGYMNAASSIIGGMSSYAKQAAISSTVGSGGGGGGYFGGLR